MAGEDTVALRKLAERCRQLAPGVSDSETAASLRRLADDYERQARAQEPEASVRPPSPPPTPAA